MIAFLDEAWPHPEIGKAWDTPINHPGAYPSTNVVLTGARFGPDGKCTHPGRIYTTAEWEQVKAQVQPFTRARMRAWQFAAETFALPILGTANPVTKKGRR